MLFNFVYYSIINCLSCFNSCFLFKERQVFPKSWTPCVQLVESVLDSQAHVTQSRIGAALYGCMGFLAQHDDGMAVLVARKKGWLC